jgi:predicted membrane protein
MDRMIAARPFAIALLICMLICLEIGRQMGKRWLAKEPEGSISSLGVIQGAMFTLYGLLLAFTFSEATSRFDIRRELIMEEANAIGTAYLRLDLLPPNSQPKLREQFREYLDSRLEAYRKMPDIEAVKAELSKSEKLQQDIWGQAVADSRLPGGQVDAARLLLPALNTMIDITGTRTMAARIHPAPIIYKLLFLLALVCSVIAGYGMATSKKRSWLHTIAFAVVTAASVYVILDIEYPRVGFIRIDTYDQVLGDLRQSMK